MSAPAPRLALVTGAAGTLGRAFCRRLAADPNSWHIVGVDRDEPALRQALAELPQVGPVTVESAPFDVTEADAWTALATRLTQNWPRLDLLVNSAGVCTSSEVLAGGADQWRRVMEINFFGTLNACHAMAPLLLRTAQDPNSLAPRSSLPAPAIINVASIFGLLVAPSLGAYSASKAAVVALSEALYAELRPRGIRVTVVAPGYFPSGLLDGAAFSSELHRTHADALMQRAKFTADDVARAALTASQRGRLYSVIGRRARWFWRFKAPRPHRVPARRVR